MGAEDREAHREFHADGRPREAREPTEGSCGEARNETHGNGSLPRQQIEISEAQLRAALRLNHLTAAAAVIAFAGGIAVFATVYLTREAIVEANRAWIAPMSADFDAEPKVGELWRVSIRYENVGREPALGLVPTARPRVVLATPFAIEIGQTKIAPNTACMGISSRPGEFGVLSRPSVSVGAGCDRHSCVGAS